jgi:hypothetical protein
MRVQVELLCSPHPEASIEKTLQAAGRELASVEDTVSVEVYKGEPIRAVLEFKMRRAAQHKAVGRIYATVKMWAGMFYEDITIRFPRGC